MEQLHSAEAEHQVPDPPGELRLVGHVRAEGGKAAGPFVQAHRRFAEVAPRDLRHLVSACAAKTLDKPVEVEPRHRRLQDEPACVARMPRAVEKDDPAAHRVAEDDRPYDSDRVAERADVVSAELVAPVLRISPLRPTMTAQVEVDHLRHIREACEVGLEVGVVVAPGPAVDEDDGRSLSHLVPVRDDERAVDVVPEPRSVHVDVHPHGG